MLTNEQFIQRLMQIAHRLQTHPRFGQPAPQKIVLGPYYMGMWMADCARNFSPDKALCAPVDAPQLVLAGLRVEYAPDLEPSVEFLLLDSQGGLVWKENRA